MKQEKATFVIRQASYLLRKVADNLQSGEITVEALSILEGKELSFCALAAFTFPENKKKDVIKTLEKHFEERCMGMKEFKSTINEMRYYLELCNMLTKGKCIITS